MNHVFILIITDHFQRVGLHLQFLFMNQSRVSQLLQHSRSRHEDVKCPELRKISRQWQIQKRQSRQFHQSFKKMCSEMNYLQSLNMKLSKVITHKRNDLNTAKSIRERHNLDLQEKQKLEQLRESQMLKNRSIADRIKQERNRRINAIKQSIYYKNSVADQCRSIDHSLKEQREEDKVLNYLKSRVEIWLFRIAFSKLFSFSAIYEKVQLGGRRAKIFSMFDSTDTQLTKNAKHQQSKRKITINPQKIEVLTEGTKSKLQEIQDLNRSIKRYKSPFSLKPLDSYKSPYRVSLHHKRKLNSHVKSRCMTEKVSSETAQNDHSIFISHHQHHQALE